MMAETRLCLTLPFPSSESAALAYKVLSVDKEVNRSQVCREIKTEGNNLEIIFYGTELKRLRVALNGILKNTLLVTKTIDQFQNSS